MHSIVIVHEDGAVITVSELPEEVARFRFESATKTTSVVYAHFSDVNYIRVNHYNRELM